MKKNILSFIMIACLSNLYCQNWIPLINPSTQNFYYFYTSKIDTVSNTLYLGGLFDHINNFRSNAIIKYNGVSFDTLDIGLNKQYNDPLHPAVVKSMAMFQNKLYVAGQFEQAGNCFANNLARWNGVKWDSINFKLNGIVTNMTVHNNELYVGGLFDSIGGIKSPNLAKYDGNNWYNVGQSYSEVRATASYNNVLYRVGGDSTGVSCSDIEYYNGATWSSWACVSGAFKSISGIKTIDTLLFVYGRFDNINGKLCRGLASWNGANWFNYNYGTNLAGLSSGEIKDISKINGELYACGYSDSIANTPILNNIAKFDGQNWCSIIDSVNNNIQFSIEYKNELFIGGFFHTIGQNSVIPLIKWNGTVNCENFVGLHDIFIFDKVKIYPNPTTSVLNITDENNQLQNTTIEIKNYLGQTVFSSPFSNQINISSLASGMYFLTVQDKENKRTVKVVKE